MTKRKITRPTAGMGHGKSGTGSTSDRWADGTPFHPSVPKSIRPAVMYPATATVNTINKKPGNY